MTMAAADEVKFSGWLCPLIAGRPCSGSACPVWRFNGAAPPALFVAAITAARAQTGEPGLRHPEAARLVADNPGRWGLPVGDARLGWCGLGGRPETAS